ncbi:stage II sporulation protein M [Tumebacillus sp. DT12]|uniref:Stage II sporulation protein M n=1 Tax=Tumebacillus lacus TaxID=2995335 RepID=A0ABT3X611_9BACL|nr:stage II sporulation protein M [Tumebacillus lacus]MCX7572339.1 stage II sporulation protein M [Tumebacillus lacus]
MQSLRILRQNRSYILLAAALFMIGWVLGAVFQEALMELVATSLQHLQDIVEKTQAKNSPLYTSGVIFLNNLMASFAMMLYGIPFAFLTVFALFLNGLTVGVVFQMAGEHGSLWEMVLYGLLPHGIFELPAIFIAAAFGIKLGLIWFRPLPEMTRMQSFKHVFREVFSISWVIVLLLVVAGLVEGLVTPVLLETFVLK